VPGALPANSRTSASVPLLHDDAVADGEGLGHRVLAIYSENVAVNQEPVGTWVCARRPVVSSRLITSTLAKPSLRCKDIIGFSSRCGFNHYIS
jgi:hypothetical protein